MAKVFYLHWNEQEAKEQASTLQDAGHDVRFHWSTEEHIKLGDWEPEAVVISLDRLPSHGRQVAEWFWEAKKRRSVPVVFAGGKPDKVEAARDRFPKAIFCDAHDVLHVIEQLTK
jgi:hypothetical protein